jgi:3-oxoadipate enol-lactonase
MKLTVRDMELYYELHGEVGDADRPWLVFSHSLACETGMWAPQLAEFARQYRVLAFDTRGHGRSAAPPGPYTMDLLAQDLDWLLNALEISKAHFVGLSMGGMIGETYALSHRDAFASLTLADTTSRWPPEAMSVFAERARVALERGMDPLVEATLGRWFTPAFHKSNPADVAKIGDMIRRTPPVGYAGCSDAIPRVNVTARLREIRCPILVMVGKEDPGTPVSMSREIHENAPGSQLTVIDNAAHLSNVEQAAVFNRILHRFLDSCASR